jgi:hypothetical protein
LKNKFSRQRVNILLIPVLHINSIAVTFIAEFLRCIIWHQFLFKKNPPYSTVRLRRYSEVCKRFHVEVVWEEQDDGVRSGCSVTAVWTVKLLAVRFCRHQIDCRSDRWGLKPSQPKAFLRNSRIFGSSLSVNQAVMKTQAQCGNT